MNNEIAFEELMKVISHIREDEMRLERIAKCLKLDIEHELLMKKIEDNYQNPQLILGSDCSIPMPDKVTLTYADEEAFKKSQGKQEQGVSK